MSEQRTLTDSQIYHLVRGGNTPSYIANYCREWTVEAIVEAYNRHALRLGKPRLGDRNESHRD